MTRTRCCWLVLVLLLLCALAQPAAVKGQCNFPTDLTAPVFCYTKMMGTMTYNACFKNLKNMSRTPTVTMSYRSCMPFPTAPTMFMNVTVCSYIMGQRRLYAQRPLAATGPASCQVTCDCGVLRLESSDGLPVELLDFKVK